MLKVAIIGTGDHSRIHHGTPCLRLGDRIDRAAVCSLDAAAAAAYAGEFGFKQSFTDIDHMIDTVRPDVMVVVTPVSANFQVAKKLIPYRIPMMLEKPPGETAAQASELLALAESSGTPVMVSFNRRFAPPLQRLCDWAAANPGLPRPQLLRTAMFRIARREPEFVMATAIHALDMIITLMGEPECVEVRPLPGMRNTLVATMPFSGGATGIFALHPDTGTVREEYELSGTGYQLRADFIKGFFEAWIDGRQVDSFQLNPESSETEMNGAFAETEYFVDCAERGLFFVPGLRHGVAVMRLAEALQKAVNAVQERM